MTDLELKLFAALKEIEDAKLEEESYRWENIASYPNVKIPTEVREKWLADLKVISDREFEARNSAQKLIKEVELHSEREIAYGN